MADAALHDLRIEVDATWPPALHGTLGHASFTPALCSTRPTRSRRRRSAPRKSASADRGILKDHQALGVPAGTWCPTAGAPQVRQRSTTTSEIAELTARRAASFVHCPHSVSRPLRRAGDQVCEPAGPLRARLWTSTSMPVAPRIAPPCEWAPASADLVLRVQRREEQPRCSAPRVHPHYKRFEPLAGLPGALQQRGLPAALQSGLPSSGMPPSDPLPSSPTLV